MELLLFIYIYGPNIYSILGSSYIEGFMPGSMSYLIEVHWSIFILLLFAILFNPSNVYALLYGAPTHGDI